MNRLKKRIHDVYLTLEISPFGILAKGFCVFEEVVIYYEGERRKSVKFYVT